MVGLVLHRLHSFNCNVVPCDGLKCSRQNDEASKRQLRTSSQQRWLTIGIESTRDASNKDTESRHKTKTKLKNLSRKYLYHKRVLSLNEKRTSSTDECKINTLEKITFKFLLFIIHDFPSTVSCRVVVVSCAVITIKPLTMQSVLQISMMTTLVEIRA